MLALQTQHFLIKCHKIYIFLETIRKDGMYIFSTPEEVGKASVRYTKE